MKSNLVVAAIVAGLLMVVLSLFWVKLFPGNSSWTPEKAAEWAEVKDRLHNLSFIVNAPPGREPSRRQMDMAAVRNEYDQVKERSEQLKAEFTSAYDSPRTMSTVLKWTGLAIVAVGVVGGFAIR